MRISDWSSDVCSSDLGNFGMMGDMVHQYRNTGADGSGRGEDKVMREVPHKGAAQTVQHGMEAFAKIDPPHGEENDEAGAQGQPQLATPGVVLADGGDGSGEREQRFAKERKSTRLKSSHTCATR